MLGKADTWPGKRKEEHEAWGKMLGASRQEVGERESGKSISKEAPELCTLCSGNGRIAWPGVRPSASILLTAQPSKSMCSHRHGGEGEERKLCSEGLCSHPWSRGYRSAIWKCKSGRLSCRGGDVMKQPPSFAWWNPLWHAQSVFCWEKLGSQPVGLPPHPFHKGLWGSRLAGLLGMANAGCHQC